jgi:FG-GAP repeat/Putative metal-binding motif/Polysaccharide deacetylase
MNKVLVVSACVVLGACSASPDFGSSGEVPGSSAAPLTGSDFHELRPAGDPAGPANFGWSVAIDGTRAVVGANRVAGAIGSEGAAYVFERQPGGTYTQSARLTSGEVPGQAAQFGYAVALKGELALIGAPYLDEGGVANSGAAYLFRRGPAGVWAQEARLSTSPQPNAYMGYAVALDRHVFVGSWGYNRVHVFGRDGAHAKEVVVTAPDAVFGDRFGASLAVQGARLVVGAPYANAQAGAVYIYEQVNNGSWLLASKVPGLEAGQRFGTSVAIDGNAVLAGGKNTVARLGRSALGEWARVDALVAPDAGFDYGTSVALTPSRAVVGAYLRDEPGKRDTGAGYLFSTNPAGEFGAPEQFLAPAAAATDYFGFSVAASGPQAIVGAYGDDDSAANGGAAYVVDIGGEPAPCGPGTPCAVVRNLQPCGVFRLSASQASGEEGDVLISGVHDFGRRVKFKLPSSLRLTTPAAGSAGFLYFRDPARHQDVRCRYAPPNPGATTWTFDGCKISRAGLNGIHAAGSIVEATEARFRLGGGDLLEGGPAVAGDIDLVEAGSCNAFSMDDCSVARSTASRFTVSAERYENARLDGPRQFAIPQNVPIVSAAGAGLGQRGEVAFWLGSTRVTLCTYQAVTAAAPALTLAGCTSGLGLGSRVRADRVVLRLLAKGFKKSPLSARLELVPSDGTCTTPSQDEDGDGISSAIELLESRRLGVSDVDRDGLANWLDSDANGNGSSDGLEGSGDTNMNLVADAYDTPCEPAPWYQDADGDGFGDPAASQFVCPPPAGYVDDAQDCDDTDAEVNPLAVEVCGDAVDDDCDAVVDETCAPACPASPIQDEGAILSQLQAGHGFIANAGGGSPHNLNDLVDFTIGTQSAWVETDGLGTAKTLKKSALGTFDFTGKMPRLWVKLDSPATASTLQLYLGSNNLADQYKFTFNSTQGQQWTTDGDWVAFSMSWSNKTLSQVGSPNRAAITDVQVRAVDDATGNPVRVHVNQFSMVDEPADYPEGVLSFTFDDGFESQFSTARPILDGYAFPATAYVIVEHVGAPNYMTLSNLTDLQDNSDWEIAYHSYDGDIHTVGFPATPQGDLEYDIDAGRAWLHDNGFTGSCDCAYPHGAFTGGTDVLGVVQAKLSSCRTIHQKHREAFPPSNPYKLRVLLVSKPVTTATVKAALDQAKLNKEWIILVFHKITSTAIANDDYDTTSFSDIVDHASTIGIPVKTVAQMLLP